MDSTEDKKMVASILLNLETIIKDRKSFDLSTFDLSTVIIPMIDLSAFDLCHKDKQFRNNFPEVPTRRKIVRKK